MYAAFFGLKQEPFSIAPDPRYLFMSERHREALAHLLYGLGAGGGFVLLSGEIGTGKTTVCRLFLEQVPGNCNVAYIFNPKLTVVELLQSICDEFHIEVSRSSSQPPTVKDYIDPLNAFLLQSHGAGRNNVLIIDEAQSLSVEVLEQLRLLTNLETRERKLLQIILIGQPELRGMLARPELEQLAQRVIARYHLDALTPTETALYIQHRMEVAGLARPSPFQARAIDRIHKLSRGVPRRINLLCDRALLGAFAHSRAEVDSQTVDKAGAEVFGPVPSAAGLSRRALAMLGMGLGLIAGVGLLAAANRMSRPPEPVVPALAAPQAATQVKVSAAVPVSAASKPVMLRDSDQAWRELAQDWGAAPVQQLPCKALAQQQLQCFSKNLSLATIRELGRPGILTLDVRSGVPAYAILTGLTRDTATLRAQGTEQTVPLAALAERWQGDFATLWRAPQGFEASGAQSAQWAAARLAAMPAMPGASSPSDTGPAAFQARLRAFQLSHGLTADGVPGPMTLMQLNRAAGVLEPRLRTES